MGYFRLTQKLVDEFQDASEVAMGVQVGKDRQGRYLPVLFGRVALALDGEVESQLALYNEIVGGLSPSELMPGEEGRMRTRVTGIGLRGEESNTIERRLNRWIETLPISENLSTVPFEEAVRVVGFLHLGPVGPLPAPPRRPPYVYGHLPFFGICSGEDVFYRFESYPSSIRIDLANARVVKADTFAAPLSEMPFIPTGLAAVSRYALPSLLPARWRYELRPEPGTLVRYGASVPLNGQSGGGVEVMFPRPFNNVGAIANPIVLPIF